MLESAVVGFITSGLRGIVMYRGGSFWKIESKSSGVRRTWFQTFGLGWIIEIGSLTLNDEAVTVTIGVLSFLGSEDFFSRLDAFYS